MSQSKRMRSRSEFKSIIRMLIVAGLSSSAAMAQSPSPSTNPLPSLPTLQLPSSTLAGSETSPSLPTLSLPVPTIPVSNVPTPSLPSLSCPGAAPLTWCQAKSRAITLVGLRHDVKTSDEALPEVVPGPGSLSGLGFDDLPSIPSNAFTAIRSQESAHALSLQAQNVQPAGFQAESTSRPSDSNTHESLIDIDIPIDAGVVSAVVTESSPSVGATPIRSAVQPGLENSNSSMTSPGSFHLSDAPNEVSAPKRIEDRPHNSAPVAPVAPIKVARAESFVVDSSLTPGKKPGIASSSSGRSSALRVAPVPGPVVTAATASLPVPSPSLPSSPIVQAAKPAPATSEPGNVPSVPPTLSLGQLPVAPQPTGLPVAHAASAQSPAPASTQPTTAVATTPAAPPATVNSDSPSALPAKLTPVIKESFPQSRIDIAFDGEGLIVQGVAASETEAKKILTVIRKSALCPVIDRVSAKR